MEHSDGKTICGLAFSALFKVDPVTGHVRRVKCRKSLVDCALLEASRQRRVAKTATPVPRLKEVRAAHDSAHALVAVGASTLVAIAEDIVDLDAPRRVTHVHVAASTCGAAILG